MEEGILITFNLRESSRATLQKYFTMSVGGVRLSEGQRRKIKRALQRALHHVFSTGKAPETALDHVFSHKGSLQRALYNFLIYYQDIQEDKKRAQLEPFFYRMK